MRCRTDPGFSVGAPSPAAPTTLPDCRGRAYLHGMGYRAELSRRRAAVLAIAEDAGASRVRLFGSVARGDDTEASDVDLLVTLAPGRTLLDLARLELSLESLLGRPVDVVTEATLRVEVREAALREAVPL